MSRVPAVRPALALAGILLWACNSGPEISTTSLTDIDDDDDDDDDSDGNDDNSFISGDNGGDDGDDDDGDDDDDPPREDLPSIGGDETEGEPPMPVCGAFDPDHVYLYGTLREHVVLDAYAEPPDMANFCVGTSAVKEHVIRPSDSRVLFVRDDLRGGGIYAFEPDPITWDGNWQYPMDTYANDTLILANPCGPEGIGDLLLSPADESFYYSCGYVTWFHSSGEVLFEMPETLGITVTAGGQLVAFATATQELFLVSPSGPPSAPLVVPRTIDETGAGRSTEDGAWIVVRSDGTLYRWRITGTEVTEEGAYSSPRVAGYEDSFFRGAVDPDGDYHQVFHGDADVDAIVRRRLEPAASEVVYMEEPRRLHGTEARIDFGSLFTGP